MKMKGFALVLTAAIGMGSGAFADTYISNSDSAGFVVTSDADMKIKAVIADYDDDGRLAGVATSIVDAVEGDNTYTYSDLGASEINGERKILLWKGEKNSIEPISGKSSEQPESTERPDIAVPGKYAEAMQAAVRNGLIDEGALNETDNITREQAAQIIKRAMGDVEIEDEDFYTESYLTCAQAYKLIATTFDFDSYYIKYPSGNKKYIGKADEACLDAFADKTTVPDELIEYAEAVVGNGGFTGFDGQLTGDSMITVGEFVYLMDSVIGTYIDEPGTYTGDDFDTEKSIIIRKGGVAIDGLVTNRNFIIAQSVDSSGVTVTNSIVTGVTSIMGGADPENRTTGITLKGVFDDLRVNAAYITVDASGAKMDYCKLVNDSKVNMSGF